MNSASRSGKSASPNPAMAAWRAAIQLDPKLGSSLLITWESACLSMRNEIDEALACYRQLLELEPENAWHHNNLAAALRAVGDLDGALAELRKAMQLAPADSHIHSGLVCTMLFHPGFDATQILAECRNWDRQHAEPLRASIRPHRNSPEPTRRLRIGYVSPNFWAHVVGRNILPLFQHHDHERFEVFCYADLRIADELTEEFIRSADHWRKTLGLTDEALAAAIRPGG